ncbi:MAG: dihydropteroate synthase [bacterium]|nr:dihydropteroate synthase [bacterium]
MKTLDFHKPLLMGILNLTPDSFSDGGKYGDPQAALRHLQQLLDEGADMIDIGAESTFGPEAQVSADEEWSRLEPILSQIDFKRVFVSVDTHKAEVAEKALRVGVQMINDVTALRGDSHMIEVLLKHRPYVCLMFSAYNTPYAGREARQYDDVIKSIKIFLRAQTELLISAGFPRDRIILDPGLGFFLSSDPGPSWEVIDRLAELKELGFPILIGPSMKSFLGGEIRDRLPKSLEAGKKCLQNGANIIRMHEVGKYRHQLF